jgi:hypothetical protein
MTDLQRYQEIVLAWETAPDGRDANTVEIFDLLPAIYGSVPDASVEEIIAALKWGSDQASKEADALSTILDRRTARNDNFPPGNGD